jgi:hypothetical protein
MMHCTPGREPFPRRVGQNDVEISTKYELAAFSGGTSRTSEAPITQEPRPNIGFNPA